MFEDLLEYFASREDLAKICGVTERTTYYWQYIKRIPVKHAKKLEKRSRGKFKAKDLAIGWD